MIYIYTLFIMRTVLAPARLRHRGSFLVTLSGPCPDALARLTEPTDQADRHEK
jgi:hypothetical protein